MKKNKIIFWITTAIIFVMEGLYPILTFRSPMAIAGITHLGYPLYFVTLLSIFKLLGGLALVLPQVPAKVKEWAYAGYTFDFTSAFISMWIVDGFHLPLLLPIVALVILYFSYTSYHKLRRS